MKKKINELCHVISSNIQINKLENNNGEFPLYGASGYIKGIDFYKIDRPYISIVKDGAGVGRIDIHEGKSSIVGTLQAIVNKDEVDLKYLYYALLNQKLDSKKTGATIPHIYFSEYGNNYINYCSLEEQKKIVSLLDQIGNLIKLDLQQIDLLDELIKSRFAELFGGEDSKMKPLASYVFFQEGPGVRTVDFASSGTILLTGSNINNNEITFGHKSDRFISNDLANGKYAHFLCDKDDILVVASAIAPEKFDEKVVIVKEDKKYCLNTGIIRFKPNLKYLTKGYFIEFLKSDYFKDQVAHNMKGIAQMHFGPSHLKTMNVLIPNSLEKQVQFEEFTQQVEKAKNGIKKRISLYQELLDKKMDEYFG